MDEPILLVQWEGTVGALLDVTARFPKAVRFTFASRIDTLALDILDALTRARWSGAQDRGIHLARADGDLNVLRTMVRLAHDRRYLDHGALERLSRALDEAGRMIGGWRRL